MTNRERAIELWKNIKESHNQILYDFRIPAEEKGLEIDEASVKLIEQALSEPQPYFDGEYYHLSLLQLDLAKKFIRRNVVFYNSPLDFENESHLNAALIGSYKDGFVMQDLNGNIYHLPFIAIPKETYERVMGEV